MTREQLLSRAVGTKGGARGYKLGFPMGRDSATFWNKGTEVVLRQRDNEKAQNLSTGWDRSGQPVKIQDRARDGTITIFLSKFETVLNPPPEYQTLLRPSISQLAS